MVSWEIPSLFEQCGDGEYTSCHMKYDFGIMEIDTSYNLWMAYGYNNADTGSETVNTAGYPGVLPFGFFIANRVEAQAVENVPIPQHESKAVIC